jgi:CBS domain-containing protein
MRHRTVEQLMTPADLVVSARPDTPYKVVAGLLCAYAISGVPVLDPTGCVIGVVTEADLLAKEIRASGPMSGRTTMKHEAGTEPDRAKALTAMDLMTSPAITAAPREVAASAAARMQLRGVRRLPVVDEDGHLLGIVSRRDLLRPYLRRDAEIRAEALVLIADEFGMVPAGWSVTVQGGVLTLNGELPTHGDVLAVYAAVGRIDGVVSVEGRPTYAVEEL